MMETVMDKKQVLETLRKFSSDGDTITRQGILNAIEENPTMSFPHWITNDESNRVGRGVYKIPSTVPTRKPKQLSPTLNIARSTNIISIEDISIPEPHTSNKISKVFVEEIEVPERDPAYIKTPHHNTIKSIIESGVFFPTFITGLSGNGKTISVEQVCAQLKRKLVRVNITTETEEEDLLGGMRLLNGETIWFDGPVVRAMKEGAILLLDEIDLGTNKLLCLQSVLEGKGVFLKKIGEYVKCHPQFNVIATANTKGQGDESGKFIGTNFLNEAFLERFPAWLEQEYPTLPQEQKIIDKALSVFEIDINETHGNFIEALLKWTDEIRKAFQAGINEELITTRRLVQILKSFKIIKDPKKSIQLCLNRFTTDTQQAFMLVFDQFYMTQEQLEQKRLEEERLAKAEAERLAKEKLQDHEIAESTEEPMVFSD